MKYRIKSLYFVKGKKITKRLRAKRTSSVGLSVLHPVRQEKERVEYITLDALLELGRLGGAKRPQKAKKRPFTAVKALFVRISEFVGRAVRRLGVALSRLPERENRLSFLSGVLVSAVLVCALCVAGVLIKLFFPFMRNYTPITVPDLVGQELHAVESISDKFELLISYENDPTVKAGTIISQRPEAGVVRKLFGGGERCSVSVTVSAGKRYYNVEDLVGQDGRSALLHLYNKGVSVKIEQTYSDTAPTGQVIATVPASGAVLYEGEVLPVRISLGKKIILVSVPDVCGLSEPEAKAVLEQKGLSLGKVTYAASSAPAGKVISQKHSPYDKIPEGSSVDVTVSLGAAAQQKKVPDLYGLTVEQAKERLSEVGLVLGSIYYETAGAPKGTVIYQTPPVNTTITSTVTSVDIYISN